MQQFSIILFLLILFAPVPACAEIVINEVFYDPEGADAGKEFVELANTGPYAVVLEGLTLEAGNGSRPDSWDLQWSGSADEAIPPGGYYRIGLDGPGTGVAVALHIQNGPDGVRLRKQGFELDRVGWGELELAEYFESQPALTVRSGFSLARCDDGVDTDNNLADFESATPTPGRPNRPRSDWAIRILRPQPEVPRTGESVLFRLRATNRGRLSASPPTIDVVTGERQLQLGWSEEIAPGEFGEESVMLKAPAETGRVTWRARLLARDEVPENDADSIKIMVGEGSTRIVEVLASPDADECEWLELRADVEDGCALSDLAIEVRGKRLLLDPRHVDSSTRIGLVVEDSTIMRARYPDLSPEQFWRYQGGWQRLRNGERGGVSDTIRLIDSAGCVTEVAMPGPAPSRGVSVERLGGRIAEGPAAWIPCPDPDGATPGREGPGQRGEGGADPLTISPRVVRPGLTTCIIEGSVGAVPGEVRLELLDLYGRKVRCLLNDTWVAGHLLATWDGRDESGRFVDPGLYVVVLEVDRAEGDFDRYRSALAVAPVGGE